MECARKGTGHRIKESGPYLYGKVPISFAEHQLNLVLNRMFFLPCRGTMVSERLMYVDNFTPSMSQRVQDVVLRVFHI